MSDNIKYYYIKLKEDFLDSPEMLMLESMPDGILYEKILLHMYLKSLRGNGKLMVNNRIPYNSVMLSTVVRQPVAVVEKAISIFQELGLIDILDNGAIYMLEIQNYIGKSSTEGDRKRAYRAKIEAEKSGLLIDVGHLSDVRPPEIEIELEKDIEKKKKKEKPVKHAYGEYKNVYLTDAELEKLQTEFPVDWERRIETMSGWLAANGRCYKNYLAALRNWAKRDNNNKTNPLVQEHKKKDLNSYWEEAVRRKKDLTNVGWSHPIVYNLAKKVHWEENNLDFERTLFLVGLNEYDAQHPNEL